MTDDIKSGEPCEHVDAHEWLGIGKTDDGEKYVDKYCGECKNLWQVWEEWDLEEDEGWQVREKLETALRGLLDRVHKK